MVPDASSAPPLRGAHRACWAALGALTALVLPLSARADVAPDDAGTSEPRVPTPPAPAPTSEAASGSADAATTSALPPPPPEAPPELPPEAVEACPAARFVLLSFGDDVAEAFAGEVRTDLAAEIAPRGLALCVPSSTAREPAAVVQVRVAEAGVAIELDDRLTHKRVERDLALTGIPGNGRALATAIAIDELLRASWAELTLQRARKAPVEPPAQAVGPRAPLPTPGPRKQRPVRRRPRTRAALGGQLGYTRVGTAHDALSLQLRATLRPGYGWLALTAGPQLSLPRPTERGDVSALGAAATLTLGACSDPGARVVACGGARGGVDWLRFRGRGGEGRRGDATLAHVAGAALVAGRLTADLYLFGEVALGALVRGARITDGSRTLGEISGMLLSLQLGLGFEL